MRHTIQSVAALCDHTMLKATANEQDIIELCKQARKYSCASVCVNGCFVKLASEQLKGSDVKTGCTVGFPLGAMSARAKAAEVRIACEDGAQEIDMVINVGMLQAGNFDYVLKDIEGVVEAAGDSSVKVIIETCYLDEDQKIKACELAMKAKAAFVKTSTGMGTGGATVSDVSLMRHIVKQSLGVKASGGVRTKDDCIAMIEAGANRIGTGSLMSIIKEFESKA